jgi:EAL domain-containing protein (putative c-di-GMP-specific phosphodiesterase class I)
VLREARRLGVRLAVNELHEAPNPELLLQVFAFDSVQLDAHAVVEGGVSRMVVARALRAASGFGRIVAKRVETADELQAVRALGATHATGFLLGHPLPPVAFLDLAAAAEAIPPARLVPLDAARATETAAARRERISA